MANFKDKFKNFFNGPYDDDYEDDYDEYEDEEETVEEYRPHSRDRRDASARTRDREVREVKEPIDYAVATRSSRRTQTQPRVEDSRDYSNGKPDVVIFKPTSYDDGKNICDSLRKMNPVVINLEKVEYPLAQRIMDFLSGSCYALGGSLQRVSKNIFLIVPQTFNISEGEEDAKARNKQFPWMDAK